MNFDCCIRQLEARDVPCPFDDRETRAGDGSACLTHAIRGVEPS